MLKIGDFSRLSRVSVKALRYYDEMGLLRPAEVDRFTGYRYYAAEQLPRLNRILALKDLGFTLEQVAQALREGVSPAQLEGMLRLKRAEVQQQMGIEQARLVRIEARLRQIQEEGKMSVYDVVIKKVPTLRVAALREIVSNYGDQGALWNALGAYLAQHNFTPTGPCLTVYHDTEYRERDVDVEVCEPVDAPLAEGEGVQIHDLPAYEMASVVHHGSYEGFGEAYGAIMAWVQANGYRIVGPNREVYLVAMDTAKDPRDFVTEVQMPVARA